MPRVGVGGMVCFIDHQSHHTLFMRYTKPKGRSIKCSLSQSGSFLLFTLPFNLNVYSYEIVATCSSSVQFTSRIDTCSYKSFFLLLCC